MARLLIALPSRERPHNVRLFLDAMARTCRADTTLLIGLDEDDPSRPDYPEGPQYVVRDGLGQRLVKWMNILTVPHTGDYDAIGHFGDDCVPLTDGWDEMVLDKLQDHPFAFGDDLERSERPPGLLPTNIFMRPEIITKLGYFGPPAFQHMYVDFAWLAWGVAAGISYMPGVVIEHMHFTSGKAPEDASYRRSRELLSRDLAALQHYVAVRLDSDVAKLTGQEHYYRDDGFYRMLWQRKLWVPRPPRPLRTVGSSW